MSDTVMLAAIAVLGPVVVSIAAFFVARANKREDWRRQDEVADQVAKVAKLAAESSKTLVGIAETGEATHRLVNSQRIVMLRALAITTRAISDDHPDDPIRRKAAEDAEHDLSEAEAEAARGAPIKVVVTNPPTNPVPTTIADPPK